MKRLILAMLFGCLSSAANAELCMFSREQVSGDNKFCFYKCLRGDEVLTIGKLGQCCYVRRFLRSTDPRSAGAICALEQGQGRVAFGYPAKRTLDAVEGQYAVLWPWARHAAPMAIDGEFAGWAPREKFLKESETLLRPLPGTLGLKYRAP